jgi:hypothetical protein
MALAISSTPDEYRVGDINIGALTFNATGETGTVNWSTSSGVLSSATGLSTVLSPFNRTEIVTITAQDSLNTVTKDIQIWATFPVQPKWLVESDADPPIARYPMVYEKRDFSEYWDVLSFFEWHQKAIIEMSEAEDGSFAFRIVRGKAFYLDDLSTGELLKVYFDSAIRRSFAATNFVNYSFQLLALAHAVPATPATGPFAGIEYGIGEFGP